MIQICEYSRNLFTKLSLFYTCIFMIQYLIKCMKIAWINKRFKLCFVFSKTKNQKYLLLRCFLKSFYAGVVRKNDFETK